MMDIRISGVMGLSEAYKPQPGTETRRARSEEKRDMYALSSQGQSYSTLRKALAAVPDIREDRVAALQAKFASGEYVIDARAIADKLIH
jgi:flagellar biosynthesis anti-sigma factor FlgM